ncbi:MAG: hypothetical protein JWN73_325 [Betaproteobacteria bacterium]|nr:hypothetical protein [Betaproteobacteria bacterium]
MFKQLSVNAKRALRAAPIAVALGLGAVASMVSAPAQAWYHHGYGPRFGFYVGPGYGYYPPAYYYPPTVIQSAPPVYIEQSPQPAYSAPAPAQNSSWYYCAGSRSYYPYVKDCPGGWQQVAPRPAP